MMTSESARPGALSPSSCARAAAGFGLCLAGALLAGCAGPGGASAVAPIAPVANAGAKVIRVTDANAGADITLERSQPLVVSLTLDVSAPQDWSLVDLKPGVLTIQSTKYERTPRDAQLADLAGVMIWTLVPVGPGSVTLNFDLRRPRSLLPATRTVTYRVLVK